MELIVELISLILTLRVCTYLCLLVLSSPGEIENIYISKQDYDTIFSPLSIF